MSSSSSDALREAGTESGSRTCGDGDSRVVVVPGRRWFSACVQSTISSIPNRLLIGSREEDGKGSGEDEGGCEDQLDTVEGIAVGDAATV